MNDNQRQYTQTHPGGPYVRCGATRQVLDPGFYRVEHTSQGPGLCPKPVVSDELIDIAGTVTDEIFSDVESFMGLRPSYDRFGLTHKRGYLFYGPPGSGKTSLGTMLARRFIGRTGGVVVYVEGPHDLIGGVGILRDVEPGRPAMYIIEEADEVLDFTPCLSILDGETSVTGAVFVAMTNYKGKLPPRIANRPGRFDRVVYVGAPPLGVQVEYLRRVIARGMAADESSRIAHDIADALYGIPLSLAHLREAFIAHHLMGLPLGEVRVRFEKMANADDEPSEELEADEDDDDTCGVSDD